MIAPLQKLTKLFMEMFGEFEKLLYLCIKDAKHGQESDLRKRKN